MNEMTKIVGLLKNTGAVTFTFVGDSITWGLNYCTAEETYVSFFAAEAAKAFPNTKVIRYDGIVKDEQSALLGYDRVEIQQGMEGAIHVIRSGVGGNTVVRAMARMQDFTGILPSGTHSDYIFTMFGINDALRSDPAKYVPAEKFKENYRTFLRLLKMKEPCARIVIMTATTNDQSIDAHVQASCELAEEEGVQLIDLHALWKKQYDPAKGNFGYGDWLAMDACHPTPKVTQIMGRKIMDDIIGR